MSNRSLDYLRIAVAAAIMIAAAAVHSLSPEQFGVLASAGF
jgi:hypothetical protein